MGRLMKGPDGDHGVDDPPADPSLITDPANEPPKQDDPPKIDEPSKQDDPPKQEDELKAPEPLTVEQLTAPEGFEITAETAAPFLEILNNNELSVQDRANALIGLHTKALADASEASSKAWDDTQTKWKDEAKSDPDVGGEKLQPALTGIGKLLDEFGDKDTRDVFDLTGAGNNVHMIKFLSKVANVLNEGDYFKAASPNKGNDPNSAAKRMFPSAN